MILTLEDVLSETIRILNTYHTSIGRCPC